MAREQAEAEGFELKSMVSGGKSTVRMNSTNMSSASPSPKKAENTSKMISAKLQEVSAFAGGDIPDPEDLIRKIEKYIMPKN